MDHATFPTVYQPRRLQLAPKITDEWIQEDMKDLTHYFADVEKSNGNPGMVTNGTEHVSKPDDVTPKKRGRVKIKISQKSNEERVCDIIESKHDLIDKTPSPFAVPKEKNNSICGEDTPKRPGATATVTADDKPRDVDLDSSEGGIYSPPMRPKSDVNGKISEGEEQRKTESSNAFQVLMTRSKPVQYVPQKVLSPEEATLEAKNAQEVKQRMKQNREKLIALADKKGYTKRKMAEAEEGERIERRLENRAKVFKRMKRDEDSTGNQNQRQSGGLHNYFSKTTPEEREKERLLALSTVTVKAEIHGEELAKETTTVLARPKSLTRAAKNKTRKVLAAIDDIQVLRSETPSPPPALIDPPIPVSESKPSKKPKWSLRINLQESEADDSSKDEGTNLEGKNNTKGQEKSKRGRKKKLQTIVRETEETNEGKIQDTPPTPLETHDDSIQILELPESPKTHEKLPRSDSDPLPTASKTPESSEVCKMFSQPILDTEVTAVKVQKLAPLFVKRQKPDPEVLAARKSFLYSRSPEDPKKKSDKKSPSPGVSILPFPSISHVTQLTPPKNPPTPPSTHRIPSKVPWIYTPTFTAQDFKSLNTSTTPDTSENSKNSEKSQKVNPEDVLKEIESRCADAREMWTTITSINVQSTEKTPKRRGRKRKSVEKPLEDEKNLKNVVWTQKYRPLTMRQIVGNEEAAMKLKTWLEAWRAPAKEDYSSGDEFYSSDNSFAATLETNQVAVLLGPHGTGKTASVYAIAKELGYTVLELNASSKRTGKKIFKDFEEATKSHRIKKSDLVSQVQIKGEKIPQNSLILVEDVDLVFEEDEGFVTATYQLASNTKRPIVMTCRGSCAHLSRMAPQQMKIHYQGIFGDRVAALLELITLAEGESRLPRPCLEKLLASGDLRKALLQLQYLVLSGSPRASEIPSTFGETLWQDVKTGIYKPAIKSEKKVAKKNEKSKERQEVDSSAKISVLETLSRDLDTVSLLSNLIDVNDRLLTLSEVKFEPSLSLIENEDMYSSSDAQKAEISKWLRCRVMDRYREHVREEKQSLSQLLLVRKELNSGVNLALSQVASNSLDNYAMRTDYLPTVRTICRAEDVKITNNAKRGNRFFHYLQSLRLPSASTKPNILAAACRIMQDDSLQSGDS